MRFTTDHKKCPKSELSCPFCKDELNMRVNCFTTYGAVNGPYVKGAIALECSNEKCPYCHSGLFKADDGRAIAAVEKMFAKFVKKLPDMGPWEHLCTNERPKRRHQSVAKE